MPIVLKRHGSRHYYRQFLRDLSVESRDDSSPVDLPLLDADVQQHGAFVLSAGFFLVLLVGYLFRRQLRSVPSRLAHAISVHGTPLNLIHIHLHTWNYSPLNDHDTTADIESPITQDNDEDEDEPAPPYYSAPQEQRTTNLKERKALHITVPPRPTFTRSATTAQFAQISSSHGVASSSSSSSPATRGISSPSTPSLFSDAGSSSAASSPVPSLSTPVSTQQLNPIDANATTSSKASALNLASPRASRWDAYPRSYDGYMTGPQNDNPRDVRASIIPNRSDILTTDSPCATPPPQYTITIHSSPRSRKNSEGEGPPVPDIILSPVPWLPREYAPPPSPPCYLSVPSRKSKSRSRSSSTRSSGASEKEKPLPPSPQQQQQQRQQQQVQKQQTSKFISDVEIKQRHASLNDTSAKPRLTLKPALPLGFNAPRRSTTLPIQQYRSILPPAPQPVLPVDLEAVYPTSPTKTTSDSEKDSGEDTPWLWRSRSPAPSKDRRLKVAGDSKSGTEKTQYNKEKECSSDSDDNIPLAQGLVLAIRRKKERMQQQISNKPITTTTTSPVSQVFKKQFFGRLSALAAKARSAIEHEFDSSDDDDDEHRHIREEPIVREKAVLAQHNFIQRELRAVDTFIIGDEE